MSAILYVTGCIFLFLIVMGGVCWIADRIEGDQ